MPTERFFKLSPEKRQEVVDAIRDEYERTSYGELHISKIARNAKISRASLYTYFSGREDLFRFAVAQAKRGKE